MATINKRKICQKHGFYNAVEHKNGCPLCRKQNNKVYDSCLRSEDRKKIYNSKRWKDVRELALLRDCMMCVPCRDVGIDTIADEVHHIIELSEDITKAYVLDNLQSICHSCHMKHHGREKN